VHSFLDKTSSRRAPALSVGGWWHNQCLLPPGVDVQQPFSFVADYTQPAPQHADQLKLLRFVVDLSVDVPILMFSLLFYHRWRVKISLRFVVQQAVQ